MQMNLATVHANQLSAPIDISYSICRIAHSLTHKSMRPRMLLEVKTASVRTCPSKAKYVYINQKAQTRYVKLSTQMCKQAMCEV